MPDTLPTHTEGAQKTVQLTEMYISIQGESSWVGRPCIFIRLARCHLRCVWCDTSYAFSGGEKVSINEILRKCGEMDCRLVEITGGEPLLQPECVDLAQALLADGYTVLVETSGTLPIGVLPAQAIKIMDLKCPDSGECDKNDWSNIDALSMRDEVKFVIASRGDYEWSRQILKTYDLPRRCNAVYLSPVFDTIEPVHLVEWILEDGLEVRFQLQLHKFIWPPGQRGV